MKVSLCLPYFIVKKFLTWECHTDDFVESRHTMILGRDLITALVSKLYFSEHVTKGGDSTFERCKLPMADLDTHEFKI